MKFSKYFLEVVSDEMVAKMFCVSKKKNRTLMIGDKNIRGG